MPRDVIWQGAIPGHIVPKGDPKPDFRRRRIYMPNEYKECARRIKLMLLAKGAPNVGKARVGLELVFHRCGRTDADEISGTIMDSMEGIIYDNDVQVDELYVRKEKAKRGEEKTEIVVKEL